MMLDTVPGMPARELAAWAKEMVLAYIDEGLREGASFFEWDADDEAALLKQRNRVAGHLGHAAKTWGKLTAALPGDPS